jgi:phage baseplate assembly protein V
MALSLAKQINACVQRALARIRLAFRAVLTALDTAPRVSLVQAEGLSSEQLQALELFQHYGFTSAPPPGTMCVVLPLGGQTAHGIVVATEHGAYRIKSLQSGEVAIYTDEDQAADGCRIVLQRGNKIKIQARDIDIRAEHLLHISGREVEIHADERLETDVYGYGEAVNYGSGGYTIDSYHAGATPLTSIEHGIQPEETP